MTEEQVFLAALDQPNAGARNAYLAEACGDDVQLRAKVEGLLAAHFNSGEFLDVPAPEQISIEPTVDSGLSHAVTIASEVMSAHQDPSHESDSLEFLAPPTRPDSLGRIDHYEVLQVLGTGGFGIVFRAFDDVLQRVVAIKVMAPLLAATSPARKRFLREARASAQVRHEYVVQVYEVGEQPLPYLVMEFIPGETLQQRVDRVGPLDVLETVQISRQVAEGLAAAHAMDLIHRDIKPGNVLLEGGQHKVKITDFGLARTADDASVTQSGQIAGTPMYMAPEQALGHPLDHRVDLFSLGSVMYQMVAGRPPFRANTAVAVLKRVVDDTPRNIREVIPETPQWLCDIIAKLHAKKPEDRYQSAREVADVLADCEEQLKQNSRLRDFSRIPRGQRATPGSWKWVAATAVLLLLPVLVLGVTEFAGLTNLLQPQAARDPLKPEVITTTVVKNAIPETTVAANRRARYEAWVKRFDVLLAQDWSPAAISDLRAKVDAKSVNHRDSYHLLIVLAYQNDATLHGEYRQRHLQQFPKFEDWGPHNPEGIGDLAGRSLSAYLLLPVVNEELRALEPIAALMKSTPGPRDAYSRSRGYLALRSGRIAEAAGHFESSLQGWKQSTDQWAEPLSACTGFELATARAKLGDEQGARAAYRDAEDLMASALERLEQGIRREFILDWMQARVSWREALDVVPETADHAPPPNLAKLTPTFRNSLGMEFVLVSKGKSWLGGGIGQLGDKEVEIPADFYLGKFEVTQEEWEKVMGENPSYFSRSGKGKEKVKVFTDAELKRFPVENVSWDKCRTFVANLNEREKETGWVYRLPSEAEWEYACRGGPMLSKANSGFEFYLDTPTNALNPSHVNFERTALGRTSKVGSYEPNRLGLHDMHGNLWEWCDETPTDNPPVYFRRPGEKFDRQLVRMIRGGSFASPSDHCRAATRHGHLASDSANHFGLRLARVPAGAPAPEAKSPPLAAAPFSDADVQRIAALPAAGQVEVVRKELMRLNPGFDGKLAHKIEWDVITELSINTDSVDDITPVRALTKLVYLDCRGTYPNKGKLSDLTPLKGMTLSRLDCSSTQISDLSPLADLPLTVLHVNHNPVSDLSPLAKMPLESLGIAETKVSDLSPLKGMKIKVLGAQLLPGVTDVSPLQGMPLTGLDLYGTTGVTSLEPLRGMPLDGLNLQDVPVSDLSPLKGMSTLRTLLLQGCKVSDLSPLAGLKLTDLLLFDKQIVDLTPLKGLPLTRLHIYNSGVSDLRPLEGMPLVEVRLNPKNITQGLDILREIKTLQLIGIDGTQAWPAAEFWERLEKGEFK